MGYQRSSCKTAIMATESSYPSYIDIIANNFHAMFLEITNTGRTYPLIFANEQYPTAPPPGLPKALLHSYALCHYPLFSLHRRSQYAFTQEYPNSSSLGKISDQLGIQLRPISHPRPPGSFPLNSESGRQLFRFYHGSGIGSFLLFYFSFLIYGIVEEVKERYTNAMSFFIFMPGSCHSSRATRILSL